MQIFHTIPFAILGLLLTGLSWCLIGIAMSDAPRRKCDVRLIMMTSYFLTAVIACGVLLKNGGIPENATCKLLILVTLNDILNFSANFGMQYTMSYAMQKGPNGIVWGIVQSATVFPFIIGMFLGDVITFSKCAGIVLLLVALALYSVVKDNSVNCSDGDDKVFGLNWKAWAFISFALTACQQTFSSLPSFFSNAVENIPVSYRMTVAGITGALCGLLVMFVVPRRPEDGTVAHNFSKGVFWWLIGILLLPLCFAELYLMYPALNILAPANMGGIGYPVMVGSCIVFFTIISWTYYREKFLWKQLLAVLLCLAGLVLLCK